MAIYLDDAPVGLRGNRLGAVLESAKQFLLPHGRIVVEVRADGQALTNDDLFQRRDEALGAIEWRLYSADPTELAMSILRQMQPLLDQARQHLNDAAGHFQADRPGEGLVAVGLGMDVWQQLPQALIHSANLLGVPLDEIVHQDQPLTQTAAQLTQQLKNLRDKMWASDSVALADLLAYEWPAIIDQWDGLIIALMDRIQSQSKTRPQSNE